MRKAIAVSILLCSQIVFAQAPTVGPRSTPSGIDSELDHRLKQEAFEKWATDPKADPKRAAAAEESEAARQFYVKAKQFVDLWQALAAELNDKKTFNVKLAKQVAKAFHDLEKSDGWPVGVKK